MNTKKRPNSSNPLRKINKKNLRISSAFTSSNNYKNKYPIISNNKQIPFGKQFSRPQTTKYQISEMNLFSKNYDEKLDVLNLIIESNPNQYNPNKIEKKIREINPMFLEGTEENLQRPHFTQNTEEVFYKYNLLYANNSPNLIRTYSPKMRPVSASISGFSKKINNVIIGGEEVFTDDEIIELVQAKTNDIGIEVRENMIYKFKDYCKAKCKNRIVDLSECFLGINSAKFLYKILYKSNRISRLNLTKNCLGDAGIEMLIAAIKHNNSLLYLNITSNNISYKGGQIIFNELLDQQSIIELNVSSIEGTNRNRLTANGIKNIDIYLENNYFVESLNIAGNSIKNEGFHLIAKGLNNNTVLKNLNISNNDIREKNFKQSLNLITLTKLYSLNISNNPLLDVGLIALTDHLKNFINLHVLNISNCKFEYKGFSYLMSNLQFIKRLEDLNVSCNDIKSSNFISLKSYFNSFGVKKLNMSKCSLGNETGFMLGECLSSNETLKKVNISDNKISDIGFKSFMYLFRNNNSIEVFDCSINFITDLTGKTFIKNIEQNHSLKKLNLYDNQLRNEIGNLLLEILENNKTLVKINLTYNRIQMKTIDEINKILKINAEKQKSKFVPDLVRNIKNLKFDPLEFKALSNDIMEKKKQQTHLYRKVKKDDKYYTTILNKEEDKIKDTLDIKKGIQDEISNINKNLEEYKNLIKEDNDKTAKIESEYNSKIEIEKKELKSIYSDIDLVRCDFNATKNDLENALNETKNRHKFFKDKLDFAISNFKSKNDEYDRKYNYLDDIFNPEKLVKMKTPEELEKERLKQEKKESNKNLKVITTKTTKTKKNKKAVKNIKLDSEKVGSNSNSKQAKTIAKIKTTNVNTTVSTVKANSPKKTTETKETLLTENTTTSKNERPKTATVGKSVLKFNKK